jgi:hypothetical protein
VHARGHVIVEDISRTGLGFRPLGPHAVRVNEVLLVAFRLDDPQQSRIQKAVRVRRIADGGIGDEFLDHDAYTEPNRILGFYLRP